MTQKIINTPDTSPAVINPDGTHPIVLICEHASNYVPAEFDKLGLDDEALESHIAWDLGAFQTAVGLSKTLDAALVHGRISRLIYDFNRPPEAAGAIPERSETTTIPGNLGLSAAQKLDRVERFYRPFETLISDVLDNRSIEPILVTIHSFTPVFHGRNRDVEIGVLHDEDTRLANSLLDQSSDYLVQRNEPYGPQDGVTHTLLRHALSRDILNVMIEVRNDLIASPAQCAEMSDYLAGWLNDSLRNLVQSPSRKAVK